MQDQSHDLKSGVSPLLAEVQAGQEQEMGFKNTPGQDSKVMTLSHEQRILSLKDTPSGRKIFGKCSAQER